MTASGSGGSTALSLDWTSASYNPSQSTSCTYPNTFGMDKYVEQGALLFSDYGYTYVSDDKSMAKYAPTGSGGIGVCAWATPNPAHAAMISWNMVYLPPNGGPGGFPGFYYLVGQGAAGPVLLVGYLDAQLIEQLPLDDSSGGSYVTYNTVSAVETATGARLYDSTADCPTNGGCSPYAVAKGRLYAIDITSPTTANGTPTMSVAWYEDFAGPSGASPMVLPAASGAPVGDRIYFDGGGASCLPSCPAPHPTLFGLQDNCPFGSTCNNAPTPFMSVDFTTLGENGTCTGIGYLGIQAAPALEGPEAGGSDPNYSVWEFAACGSTLYRFDAVSGQPWPSGGGGVGSINVGNFTLNGQQNYLPSSTMNTVVDSHTGHTTMFVGAQLAAGSFNSYVLALDLETDGLFWAVHGPTSVKNTNDTPFNGQFPIAQTTAGGTVQIAATRGQTDGSTILAIPLS